MPFSTASSTFRTTFRQNKTTLAYAAIFLVFWISTLVGTPDFSNWMLENVLTFAFLIFLTVSHKKFKFSDMSYTFMFVYLCLHVYGAKYTYAENPFGYWLQDQLDLSRNHYDRIVHFSFGFMLAYPMRDLFKNYFAWPVWICWVLPTEITLSFSGFYELIEWAVADLLFPEQGTAYLGTQGDVWDAQKDMGLAFVGAILIMLITSLIKKLKK